MALELRKAGGTLEKIAQALGCGKSQAHRYVTKGLQELCEKTRETAEQLRALENYRLDRMLLALSSKIEMGDVPAINAALRIMERRAKLYALDALPIEQEPQVVTVRFEDPELARIETGFYDHAPALENSRQGEMVAGLEMVVDKPFR